MSLQADSKIQSESDCAEAWSRSSLSKDMFPRCGISNPFTNLIISNPLSEINLSKCNIRYWLFLLFKSTINGTKPSSCFSHSDELLMLSMGYKKTAKVDLRTPAQSTQFTCYFCQRDTDCSLSKVNKGRGVDCVTMKSCPECDLI